MTTVERWVQRILILACLALVLGGFAEIARAREFATALPVPNRTESGDRTYCAQWAEAAVYGIAKYLRAPREARERALVFGYETAEQDRAHPESIDTIEQNGEIRGLVTLITDGTYDNGAGWYMTEGFKRWAEEAMAEGWKWAKETIDSDVSEARMIATPVGMVKQSLHGVCMKRNDVSAGLIYAASSQRIVEEQHAVEAAVARLRDASFYSGLPLPNQLPTIHRATRAKLQEMVGCTVCKVRALQREADIYVDETLNLSNPFDSSILLHEYVHYLQWVARGSTMDCEEWLARERQAYSAQIYALEQADVQTAGLKISMQMLRCQ